MSDLKGNRSGLGRRRRRFVLPLGFAVVWLVAYIGVFYGTRFSAARTPRGLLTLEMVLDAASPGGGEGRHLSPIGLRSARQRAGLSLVAGCLVAGALGWGAVLLRLLKLNDMLTALERFVLAFAGGTAVLSLPTLLSGLVGLMHRGLHVALLAAGPTLAAMCWLRGRTGESAAADVPRRPMGNRRAWLCVLSAVPFVVVILLTAMLPPDTGQRFFDIKEYHLQGPKEFFVQGRITFLPHNVYTNMPLGTEMLSLLAMIVAGDWWWGALSGQLMLACFAPMTALLLVAAGRRFFLPPSGALAGLIYLATPAVFDVTSTAYVEGGLCYYLAAAVFCCGLLCWGDKAQQGGVGRRGRLALLAGILAGAAAACKYPAVLYAVLPVGLACSLPVAALHWLRGGSSPAPCEQIDGAWKRGALFVGGVLLTFGPWIVRNTADTGNPVYPLLWRVFGGESWTADQDARWRGVHGPPGFSLRHLGESAGQVLVGNQARSVLNPLLFGLAPLALLHPVARRRAALLVVLAGYILLIWWTCTHRIDRFWYPVIPLLAMLAGVGATWSSVGFWRRLTAVVVPVALLVALVQVATSHPSWPKHRWKLFAIDLEQTRAEFTKGPLGYLNAQLPRSAVLLVVGEAAVFDLRPAVFYHTAFDDGILDRRLGRSASSTNAGVASSQEIGRELSRLGITHIYVDWAEIARYRSAGNYGYSEAITPARLDALVQAEVLGPPLEWRYPKALLPAAWRSVFDEWSRRPEPLQRPGDGESAAWYALYPVIEP